MIKLAFLLPLLALGACNNELSERQRSEVTNIARQEAESAAVNQSLADAKADAAAAMEDGNATMREHPDLFRPR